MKRLVFRYRCLTTPHLVGLMVAAASVACGSLRGPALQLSQSGVGASASLAGSLQPVRDELDLYIEASTLKDGLLGIAHKAPMQDVASVAESLTLRLRAFDQLSSAYSEFGNLARYDAEAEVKGATEQLGDAVNAYAAVVDPGGKAPVGGVIGELAERGLGLTARARQNALIRSASADIRIRVEALRDLAIKESVVYVNLAAATSTARGSLVKQLYRDGLACPHPLLRSHAEAFGMAYDPPGVAAASGGRQGCKPAADSALLQAVEHAIDGRVDRAIAAQAALLSRQQLILNTLISMHVELEKGEPLDLDGLHAQLYTLREFAESLRDAMKSGASPRE